METVCPPPKENVRFLPGRNRQIHEYSPSVAVVEEETEDDEKYLTSSKHWWSFFVCPTNLVLGSAVTTLSPVSPWGFVKSSDFVSSFSVGGFQVAHNSVRLFNPLFTFRF